MMGQGAAGKCSISFPGCSLHFVCRAAITDENLLCISRGLSLSRTKTFFIFPFQEYDALQVRIILLYKDSNLFIW